MSNEQTAIIQSLYEAFERRDMQTIMQIISPQVTVYQTEVLPWGGNYEGYEGLTRFFGKLLEHLDSRVEAEEYIEAGEKVVAIGRTLGRVKANGKEFSVRIAHLWTLKEQRVVRFEAYIDTRAMLKALKD